MIEYSLLTPLGKGQAATMTIASPCVVTSAAHNLSDGVPIVFSTTVTLPTGLVSGTTYYARVIDANTFNLYNTRANAENTGATTGRINTSGSQSGTHTATGKYWNNLDATGRARYGTAGNERAYKGMYYWESQLVANANISKQIVLEVSERWTDTYATYTAGHTLNGYFSIMLTSTINGVYGSGFHGGLIGGGYVRSDNYNTAGTISGGTQLNVVVDGVELINSAASGAVVVGSSAHTVKNCIIKSGGTGLLPVAANCILYNNFVHDCVGVGITLYGYTSGSVVYNNTVVGCSIGIQGNTSYINHIIGNVCVGNTTNWGTACSGGFWANNAGATGDTIWTTAGYANITGVTSADFKNYAIPATASTDFHPAGDSAAHTSSSKLVDVGSQLIDTMVAVDNVNNVRPSYKNGSATNWDIGAYEFDWGYGLAPLSATLTLTGLALGTEVHIYKSSDSTQLAVSEGTAGTTFTYNYTWAGDVGIFITILKEGKKWIRMDGQTLTATGLTIPVFQADDLTFNNPA